jgi:hypothetical protein
MYDLELVPTYRVSDVMKQQGVTEDWLVEHTALDDRVVRAIVHQRYTPSPRQRTRVARALNINRDNLWWGHEALVEPLKEPI